MISRVEDFLGKWERENSPGLALALVKDGKVIFQRCLGMANLDYGIPITTRTVFRVASLAKQFTAACIGLLEEDGALALTDDIHQWLPELPQYQRPVTIGQLLWHTSGIQDFPHLLWGLSGRSFGDAVTEAGVLDILARNPETDFAPGTRHYYCNSGYFLLGVIVSRITGQSLAEFARQRIFEPLGMGATHFQDDYTRVIPNRAIGYAAEGDGYRIFDSPTTTLVGDDGLFTTLEDMLIWEQNFSNNRLGKGGLGKKMLEKGQLSDGSPVDYGYGLFLQERKGLDLFWHYGEYLGLQSVIRCYPKQDLSIICLANTSELAPIDFARELEDILLADQFQPESTPVQEPLPLCGQPNLEKYTGLYCNRQEGFTIETKVSASGALQMVLNNKSTFNLTMTAEDKAVAADLDFPLGLILPPGEMPRFFNDDLVFPLEPLEKIPQPPTPEELALLAGEYYSPALMTSWIVLAQGNELRLVNKDGNRLSPQDPLVHVFEDFYIAWFDLWRRKLYFVREAGTATAMVILNGESVATVFRRVKEGE